MPELAARTNLSAPTYSWWEQGRATRMPNAATLETLVKVFQQPAAVVAAASNEAHACNAAARLSSAPATEYLYLCCLQPPQPVQDAIVAGHLPIIEAIRLTGAAREHPLDV